MRRIIGLSTVDRAILPARCAGCTFWESREVLPVECASCCDDELAAEWVRSVAGEWGECGRVAVENGEVVGLVKYAPVAYVPQAEHLPVGPPPDNEVLIMCMHVAPSVRRAGVGTSLLRAAMRDLAQRGERSAQAYATTRQGDISRMPVVGVDFLLRNGFTVERPHPWMPLLRVDLKAIVPWNESVESLLGSFRLPLGSPRHGPVPLA